MSDNVGNTLGPKGYFVYETDGGQQYAIQQDCSLAQAVGNSETISNLPRLPARARRPITPRTILLESLDVIPGTNRKARKEIAIGDPDSPFFQATSATQLLVNGIQFTVTARKGERVFYPTIGGCDAQGTGGNGD